jgi:hypothetical protein
MGGCRVSSAAERCRAATTASGWREARVSQVSGEREDGGRVGDERVEATRAALA